VIHDPVAVDVARYHEMPAPGRVVPDHRLAKLPEPGGIEIPSLRVVLLGAGTQAGAGGNDLERLGTFQLVQDPALLRATEHRRILAVGRRPVIATIGQDNAHARDGGHAAVDLAARSGRARQIL